MLGIFANAAAFNLPCSLALYETPPSARMIQTAHLRGAPYSALPNAAGGGEAAVPLPDRPQGGQARRALTPIFASALRGVSPNAEIIRHCKSRCVRRFSPTRRLSTCPAFSHFTKRRRPRGWYRRRTCAARRIRLCRMRLAAAKPPPLCLTARRAVRRAARLFVFSQFQSPFCCQKFA